MVSYSLGRKYLWSTRNRMLGEVQQLQSEQHFCVLLLKHQVPVRWLTGFRGQFMTQQHKAEVACVKPAFIFHLFAYNSEFAKFTRYSDQHAEDYG